MGDLMNRNLMCSLEIAELTGKLHTHVMRDIRKMLSDLELGETKFGSTYADRQGKTQKCFDLPRRECEILITGYDTKRRAAVIDRWYDLETGKAQPLASINEQLAFAEATARIMNLKGSALLGLMRRVQDNNNIPNMLPDYAVDAPEESAIGSYVCDSATALIKDLDISLTTARFNKLAHAAGYLSKESRASTKTPDKVKYYWSVTDKGSAFGKNETNERNQKETTPRWYKAKFGELIELLLGE